MMDAVKRHWPEYLMEGALLGAFMVSACLVTAALELPGGPLREAIPDGFHRRALGGLAMGLTAAALFYSPWGKQSGAHINPVVTLVFWRLGKVPGIDAAFYAAAQFAGGLLGVFASALLLGPAIAHPAVNHAATLPGEPGRWAAFAAEAVLSFGMMTAVLVVSNSSRARLTGLCAATLVALYITVEAPLSGMSMNPARTLGSALPASLWGDLWIYFLAPPLGMLAAAEVHRRRGARTRCAKLHHQNTRRCIFCAQARAGARPAAAA